MSTKQRERATRRQAARVKGTMPPATGGVYDDMALTPKGRAMLRAIRDKVKGGVPVNQLGDLERTLLAFADAGLLRDNDEGSANGAPAYEGRAS